MHGGEGGVACTGVKDVGKNLYISSCFIAPFTGRQVHGYIKPLKLFESHQDESTGPLISSVDESSSKRR